MADDKSEIQGIRSGDAVKYLTPDELLAIDLWEKTFRMGLPPLRYSPDDSSGRILSHGAERQSDT